MVARRLSIVAVVGIPSALTCLLLWVFFRATIFDFVPYLTDETHYWHEVLTFTTHGFDGGYYSFLEKPAPASFTHFGAHGPVFAMLYGTIGRLTGWHYYTGVLLDMLVVTLALALYIALTHPDRQQLLLLSALLLTFWPMLLFLPTFFQESFHQAVAIALAGLFFRVQAESRRFRTPLLATLIVSSLIRPTWSFLFIAYFQATANEKDARSLVRSVAKASILIAAFFSVFAWYSAPFPYGLIGKLKQAADYREAASLLFWNALKNSGRVIWLTKGTLLEIAERYQIVLLLVGLCGVPYVIRRWPRNDSQALFHAVNLGLPLAFAVVFYDVYGWRDQRLLAPHLTLSLLLLIARQQRVAMRLVAIVVISNIVIIPAFIKYYRMYWDYPYRSNRARLVAFQDAASRLLIYREDPNAWCNTILWKSSSEPWPYEVIAVPAGIGLSFSYDKDSLDFPLKSRYVLLDPINYDRLKNRAHLQLLGATPLGRIYLNLDSRCGSRR